MFDPDYWKGATTSSGKAGGRGAVIFLTHQGQNWVLRHYYRGGFPGKLLNDQFLWLGMNATRSLSEWNLLREMRLQGLPSPAPVAARYVRRGLTYTADLVTVRLPGVLPLSTRLEQGRMTGAGWHAVGACIARFHSAGFCHADLNAHNVQLDDSDAAYLLDWDRGRRRKPGSWRESNLDRLQRSLRKISKNGTAPYDSAGWERLNQGYQESLTG